MWFEPRREHGIIYAIFIADSDSVVKAALSMESVMSESEHYFSIVCPKCGQQLIGPPGKTKPEADDIVRCPMHGPMGRFKDAIEQGGEAIARQFGDEFEKMLKGTGFTITKK